MLTLLAVALFGLTAWVLWRTAFGLRLRSVGESPVAAETLGVNVLRYKFVAVLVSAAWPVSVAGSSRWSRPTSTATARREAEATSVSPR